MKERKQWYWVIIEKKGNKEIYGPYTSEKEAMKYGSDIRILNTSNKIKAHLTLGSVQSMGGWFSHKKGVSW